MRRSQGAQQNSVSQAQRSPRRDEKDATTRNQDADSVDDQEFMEPYSNDFNALHAASEDARYNVSFNSFQIISDRKFVVWQAAILNIVKVSKFSAPFPSLIKREYQTGVVEVCE